MDFELERRRMVSDQLVPRGIRGARLLAAFLKVPRHRFVPKELEAESYCDRPIPIGAAQTVSQPYIQALMTQMLSIRPEDRVLEIGTGSGYQTAILAELTSQVYSIERRQELFESASRVLAQFKYTNIMLQCGDGTLGWPEYAPFNGILVTAAAPEAPRVLLEQLAEGGHLVIPIGSAADQILTVVGKQGGEFRKHSVCSCVFVPLIGAYGYKEVGDPERENS